MRTLKEYESEALDKPAKQILTLLGNKEVELRQFTEAKPTALEGYKGFMTALETLISEIKDCCTYDVSYESVTSLIEADMSEEALAHLEKYQDKIDDVFAEVDALKEKISEENKEQNRRTIELQSSKNTVYQALEQKRQTLEAYSNKIFDLCSQYDIYTSDLNMDNNSFTPQELDELYDEYLKYMSKEEHLGNPISWFRETFPDSKFQLAAVGIFIVLGFTPVMDVVALALIVAIVFGQFQSKKRMKYYTVLMGIVFNIKPLQFGYKEVSPEDLLPEEIDEDTDERFAVFEQRISEIEQEQDDTDPSVENQKILAAAELHKVVIDSEISMNRDEINKKRDDLLFAATELKNEVDKWFEETKSSLKLLGQDFNPSVVFNTKFRIGIHDEIFEESVDVGTKNIIINPGMSVDTLYRFIRVLWANAVLNVKPGYLTTYVFDPNEFGQVLIPYFTSDVDKLLIFEKDSLDKILKDLT